MVFDCTTFVGNSKCALTLGDYFWSSLCLGLGYKKVIVEMDSFVAIVIFNYGLMVYHSLYHTLCVGLLLINCDWLVKVNHALRESNRVADSLAEFSLDELFFLPDPPSQCLHLL